MTIDPIFKRFLTLNMHQAYLIVLSDADLAALIQLFCHHFSLKHQYNWSQDYISLVNPSPSYLHKSRFLSHPYTVGRMWEEDHTDEKIYYISSHLLFWDREGPVGNPQKPSKSISISHYRIQYLIP